MIRHRAKQSGVKEDGGDEGDEVGHHDLVVTGDAALERQGTPVATLGSARTAHNGSKKDTREDHTIETVSNQTKPNLA